MLNDLVSRNVRRFRGEHRLSLGELAVRAGLSKQTLSKIEAGTGNPTVETLERLARALGVNVRRLLTEWGTRTHVSRAADAVWQPLGPGTARHLDRIYGSGFVRTELIRMDGGLSRHTVPPHSPGTLHQVFVVEGRLEAGPERESVVLEAGDFARFPGDVPHVFRAVDGPVVAHMTTTAPQLPQTGPDAGRWEE